MLQSVPLYVMKSRFLTPREVAAFARVHPVTVRRWILLKKLFSVKIGGVRRIPMEALLEFLEVSSRRKWPTKHGGGDAA